jgi:hypothetical protein
LGPCSTSSAWREGSEPLLARYVLEVGATGLGALAYRRLQRPAPAPVPALADDRERAPA